MRAHITVYNNEFDTIEEKTLDNVVSVCYDEEDLIVHYTDKDCKLCFTRYRAGLDNRKYCVHISER